MQRKNIMILMISLSLILLLGSSYALLRSREVGSNPYLINVGTLQVTFDSGKTEKLSLENMYPMSDKEGMSQSDELGFTVKNTGTVASYYDITIEETSTNPEFKSVIRFISNKDNQGYNEPKILSDDKFIEVGGYLKPDESSSYKVKIWLDYNAGNEYMDKTFTAKVVVNSFQESDYAKDVVKSKLVKYSESSKETFTGGLVAVNTDGDLYNETNENQEIREYRYSGATVNNYVTFNNEIWRIVGIFKDGSEEFVKIVRNKSLEEKYIPLTFTKNNIVYSIKALENNNRVYWNKNSDIANDNNFDWTKAGLQYYLNSETSDDSSTNYGYYHYLTTTARDMIRPTIYYLGNVYVYYSGLTTGYSQNHSAIKLYNEERETKICENDFYEVTEVNCFIYSDHSLVWSNGKIGLLYPSDISYATNSNNWNNDGLIPKENWLNINENFWLISKSIERKLYATTVSTNFNIERQGIYNSTSVAVRPTLYLKSNVKITSGNGTFENPYQLEI